MKLAQAATAPSATAAPVKKELAPQISPLEKRLQDMGSIRDDGSDKFFGMENVRNFPSGSFSGNKAWKTNLTLICLSSTGIRVTAIRSSNVSTTPSPSAKPS